MIVLSRPISPDMPTYQDDPAPVFDPVSLISGGDVGNWHKITLFNHCSTHVDAPWHFNESGPRITDLDPSWWFYGSPRLIDVPKGDDELIGEQDLSVHEDAISEADLLLVRTGHAEAVRDTDRERWGRHSPGFEPSAATYLRRFERLRCLGMDVPSATAPAHPEEGIAFHRIALGMESPPGFFLIVEDVRLDRDLSQSDLGEVVMAPVQLADLDGAPVTMFSR